MRHIPSRRAFSLLTQRRFAHLSWTGTTWAVDGNGRAYNTPTLGSELGTDPGLEAAYSAGLCGTLSKGGSPTVAESADVHGGSKAQEFTATATTDRVFRTFTVAANKWISASIYGKRPAGATGTANFRLSNSGGSTHNNPITTAAYTQLVNTLRTVSGGAGTTIVYPAIDTGSSSFDTVVLDDYSLTEITPATMYATVDGLNNYLNVTGRFHAITNTTSAGIVGWLDDAANPQNLLKAYREGNALKLDKYVGGTPTNLITIGSAFVVEERIEIRRPSGNIFQLWFNDRQLGTDQTVSDAGIISNTRYGLFSTYSGNLFTEFTLDGFVVPFGLPGA